MLGPLLDRFRRRDRLALSRLVSLVARGEIKGFDHFDPVDTVRDSCGTGGCVYLITVRPDGARRPIKLEIDGCRFQRGTRRAHGIYDLVSWWRLGTDEEESRYRFDGKRFRRTRVNARR